jgi:hypothetical protein
MLKMSKKAAIELSISTIVVIVIAMAMLVLGLVLVSTIFKGATYNVDQLNQNVEAQINKLFNDNNQQIVLYLPNNEADVKQGQSFGVAFAVKNNVQGESSPSVFTYNVTVSSVQKGCSLTNDQASGYLILGDSGTFNLSPGQLGYSLIKVQPPSTAPLCEIKYNIDVAKGDQPFAQTFFILKIIG